MVTMSLPLIHPMVHLIVMDRHMYKVKKHMVKGHPHIPKGLMVKLCLLKLKVSHHMAMDHLHMDKRLLMDRVLLHMGPKALILTVHPHLMDKFHRLKDHLSIAKVLPIKVRLIHMGHHTDRAHHTMVNHLDMDKLHLMMANICLKVLMVIKG